MPRKSTKKTLFDSDLPLPRTIAFGLPSKDASTLPRSVGRYQYRQDFPKLVVDDLFGGHREVVLLIREFLRSACYPFSDEPRGEDTQRFPDLNEFIAQVIVISNVPYCVVSGTLFLIYRYINTYAKWYSEAQWCPWMNAYDIFLCAFILSATSAVEELHDYTNLRYWAKITGINFDMHLWMIENFCAVIKFKHEKELAPIFTSFNEAALARGYLTALGDLADYILDFGCLNEEEEGTCESWLDPEPSGVESWILPDSEEDPKSVGELKDIASWIVPGKTWQAECEGVESWIAPEESRKDESEGVESELWIVPGESWQAESEGVQLWVIPEEDRKPNREEVESWTSKVYSFFSRLISRTKA